MSVSFTAGNAPLPRDQEIANVESSEKTNAIARANVLKGEILDGKLNQFETRIDKQDRKLKQLTQRNDCCFKLFLILAVIAVIVGSILLARKLM